MSTDGRIREIEERLERASRETWSEDAALIVSAPTDLRYLLDEVKRLLDENHTLRTELQKHAAQRELGREDKP